MTAQNTPWQSYRKVSAQTASPAQLVLMLYDGAIGFLEKSLTGFDYKDPLQFNRTINNNVQCAQAIIYEMNARLNMKEGGEVAENFRRLYDYFHRRLREANIKKKKPPIEEVTAHLRELREGWAEMLHRGQGTEDSTSRETDLHFG
jgi:flagellar protein FliS